MLEIESADVHLLKSEPCQPAKKIVSVTLLRRGFPVFETTWADPLPSQHVTAQVSWMALSTPTCGGQGFLYADHRCGRSFTAFKMVVIASLRSLGISSPNQNTEIPKGSAGWGKKNTFSRHSWRKKRKNSWRFRTWRDFPKITSAI